MIDPNSLMPTVTRSLDAPVTLGADESVGDLLPGFTATPEEILARAELRQKVSARLWTVLPEREAKMVSLRYGIGDGEPLTLVQVGVQFGLTRERVRQIIARALQRLREPMTQLRRGRNNRTYDRRRPTGGRSRPPGPIPGPLGGARIAPSPARLAPPPSGGQKRS